VGTPVSPESTARRRRYLAAGVGVVAGLLSGLFGVGGGIVLVPLLVLVVGLDPRRAAATSLAAVIPIAVFGLLGYAVRGQVDWVLGLFISLGALLGTLLGTRLLARLPERRLMFGFSTLLLLVAIRLPFAEPAAIARESLDPVIVLQGVLLGLLSGVLAGLFGVGGGFVIVPAMVLLFGEPAALAKGTSLLVIVPTALMGTWLNARTRLVDRSVASVTGAVGAVASFGFAQVSVGLDERLANLLFALLLVAVAVRMAFVARAL
jgi:uncharacterized protein